MDYNSKISPLANLTKSDIYSLRPKKKPNPKFETHMSRDSSPGFDFFRRREYIAIYMNQEKFTVLKKVLVNTTKKFWYLKILTM